MHPSKLNLPSTDNTIPPSTHNPSTMVPRFWGPTETRNYVRKVVHDAMDKKLKDDELIFDKHGSESDGRLQHAEYIRNSFIYAVCQYRPAAVEFISQDFVYAHPTIAQLSKRLIAVVLSSPKIDAGKLQEMVKIISDLSVGFPQHQPRPRGAMKSPPGEVVLLTGTTGGLGSQLLAFLAKSPHVFHVYALNRKHVNGDKSLRDRQVETFIERGLDTTILDSPKVTLVEGDATVDGLAIDSLLYHEICNNITLIIHNAWKVHLTLPLKSFMNNIRSVRTLIDVALASPRQCLPRFIFISSAAVFRNWNTEKGPPREGPVDHATVVGSGYAESKFVAERILENAARSTPLRPIIVRIGQLTGTPNGAWNCSDWVPLLVKIGQVVGALPARLGSERITWLSLDIAAQAIFDFRHSEAQYLHLAHPKPALWSDVFDTFSSRLNLPLINQDDWIAKFDVDGFEAAHLRLWETYGAWLYPISMKNREPPGFPMMDLTQALASSSTLANPLLPQISSEDAEKWIRYWRMVGFVSNDDARL